MIDSSGFMSKADAHFRAPARINLIGEHIDYNGGLVLPACINLYIDLYVKKRNDNLIRVKSEGYNDIIETTLDDLEKNDRFKWALYTIGIFYILKKSGYNIPFGLDLYYKSSIPSGSGLSSSAAVLNVTGLMVSKIYGFDFTNTQIVFLSKSVENDYCSLESGVMDEAIIALGKENNALLLDCKNFNFEYKNINLGRYKIAVLKTNKPRKLIESKYNERVYECQKALSIIKTKYDVSNLCQLDSSSLDDIEQMLNDDVLFRRVRHVVTENERVKEFVKALEKSDVKVMAKILNESHHSLRRDYEVTGLHLDMIVSAALNSGALGARMTGAGFGGCAIAIVENSKVNEFIENVLKKYKNKTKLDAQIFIVDIVDGIKKVE